MTPAGPRARMHDLRTFAAGAGCGLLAGLFLLSMIVWQFGNVIGSRAARLDHPPDVPHPMARWGNGSIGHGDVDVAVLERAPEAAEDVRPTTGRTSTSESTAESAVIGPDPSSAAGLEDRELEMPVEGVTPESLTRQFDDARGVSRRHEAIDILAPRNTPVKAVEAGMIARLFHSKAGGITIYQFDPSRRFCYYYAHLERYAAGLREGDSVRKGQVLGYVGSSGNAPKDTPHLHFAIFRLTAEKRWWEGTPVDPYDVLR
ncbi:MAG TPA: M23 family metallopeptidase [Vicinamibacterales bacterium]|nr:M23 family metallopeptidase [Vicinamibacterales bacterium]